MRHASFSHFSFLILITIALTFSAYAGDVAIHPITLSLNCHDTEKIQIKKSVNQETIYEILDAYHLPHDLRYSEAKCSARDYAPSGSYEQVQCNGFWILIQAKVFDHPQLASHGYQVLCEKLFEAQTLLTPEQFARVHNVPFWIEWNALWNGSRYHPFIDWLNDNHVNSEKIFGVEITNLRNFINAIDYQEPLLVMHELAHAYHDQVIGNDFAPVHDSFAKAKSEGLYESVALVGDAIDVGYAITDEQEYFAELTESYFGQSEFYPFTNEELRNYDPVGFAVVKKIWQNDPSVYRR